MTRSYFLQELVQHCPLSSCLNDSKVGSAILESTGEWSSRPGRSMLPPLLSVRKNQAQLWQLVYARSSKGPATPWGEVALNVPKLLWFPVSTV